MKALPRLGILIALSLLLAGCGHHHAATTATSTSSTISAVSVTTTTSPTTSTTKPPVMVTIAGVVKPVCPGALPGLAATCYASTKLVGQQASYTVSGHFRAEVIAGVYQTTTETCRVSMPISLTSSHSNLSFYGQCPANLPATPGGAISKQTHPDTGPAPKVPGHGGKPVAPVKSQPPTS
jgi:hypothetical protein